MALKGRAFLAIWHDIADSGEAEYNVWHTRQHMPERIGVPGFLGARRFVDRALSKHRYFTLYEAVTLETFSSDAYRARLNNPSRWSNRTQPNFLNFARSACVLMASIGRGTGGAMATIRLDLKDGALADFEANAETLAHRFGAIDGITGAHFGVAAPETTRIKTRETELRSRTGEDVFDAVIMIEGIGRHEVEAAMTTVRGLVAGSFSVTAELSAVYDLAYMLTALDVA
jgi:hypothetical protein